MDRSLSVPSWRMNALAECVVARLTDFWKIGETGERDPGTPLPIDTLLRDSEFPLDRDRLVERLTSSTEKHRAFRVQCDRVVPIDSLQNGQARTLRQRWYDLRRLFESVCEALFRERRPDALQLRYPNTSRRRARWMDTEDLKFLTGLGQRVLVETCWRERILLLGVVKDSASRYLSRNYLGLLHATGRLRVPAQSPEPAASDRLICEIVPLVEPAITEPWSTVEFDSVFMTLRAVQDENGVLNPGGVKGNVLAPSDGLFLRSLVQMFIQPRPEKKTPLMGHVLFMDRLADPHFDSRNRLQPGIQTRDSTLHPVFVADGSIDNPAQDIATLVAYLLTRNCSPEAIGQPDPLHRADQRAKALGKQINQLVRSSVDRMRSNPLAWSFRDTRGAAGR